MPLNSTKEEREQVAADDLASKMKLELRLTRELNELFGVMTRDMQASILLTGRPQDAQIYLNDFIGLLTRSYRRTNEAFSGRIFDFLEDNVDNEDEPIIAILIAMGIAFGIGVVDVIGQMQGKVRAQTHDFIQSNVSESSRIITQTNQRHMDTSFAKTDAALTEKLGRQPTNKEISGVAARDFRRKTIARAKSISVTETQKAAEGTKHIEREVFFDTLTGPSAVAEINQLQRFEVWGTIGDEVVRPSHVVADGIRKNEDGVFRVQNQSLLFPGDTSLGATADNVIGCRCAAIMVIP